MQAARYTPLRTDCPRKGCGALAGEPCKDRNGKRRAEPHAVRFKSSAVKPLSDKQREYIRYLRTVLGSSETGMPRTAREGVHVIRSLKDRADAADRRAAAVVEPAVRERSSYRVADGSRG